MLLPTLNEIPTTREMIAEFGGYNHNLRISEGEFYNMKNLTSSDYPVLSPRPPRGIYASPNATNEPDYKNYPPSDVIKVSNPQGLIEKDALCYVDGSDIVINGYKIDMGLSTDEDMCPKTLISMGAYIIIMPDKKYINTSNYGDKGNMDATYSAQSATTYQLCKLDGSAYPNPKISDTAPTDPKDGDMWIDTSGKSDGKPSVLKQYSTTNSEWISINTTYVKITFLHEQIVPFVAGDGVTISGITNERLLDFNGTMVVQAAGNDDNSSSGYIIVKGILDEAFIYDEISPNVTVTRRMPEMDMVIEAGNRLWGCKYGFDIHNNFVNEIYASKLGDFKNWNVFDGISTDSYVASVGTDGFFTGAITHLGYPIFFKENCMHKVYGNFPANFQIQTTTCRGVQKGCNKSLAIVNEVLYYKSRNAICAYDGSLPQEISSALGDETYSNAVAGAIRNKYYVSMADSEGTYHLFAFDTKRGLWHREDNTHVVEFCACRGDLYYIESGSKKIKTILGSGVPDTSPILWMAESGIIGTNMPDKKYISRLDVRMMLTIGTRAYFYIEYDSSGKWEHLFTMTGRTLQSFPVPIRPHRCDHMRIRIEGDGEAKIFSICKTIEQGSDH